MSQHQQLLNRALSRARPGDILFLAGEMPKDQPTELLGAARQLRNLMAYPAAVEILDRVLESDPSCVKALEQKVVSLVRMGPEHSVEANALLEEAISLAEVGTGEPNETIALLGRLNKERWCRSWYAEADDLDDGAIEQNCALAVEGSYYLWAAIDNYTGSFAKTNTYYDAINAVSLLALAGHLNGVCPGSQPRPESSQQKLWADVCSRAIGVIEGAAAVGDDEEAYWVAATQLEWAVVRAGESPDAATHAAIEDLADRVVRRAGPRRFLLDSTIHQFRLFRCLGFHPEVVGPVLEGMETALRFTPDPSSPRQRIVFAECAARDGVIESCLPARRDAEAGGALRLALETLLRVRDNVQVLIGMAGSDSVACAEACRELGIAYQMFLPVPVVGFVSTLGALLGDGGQERFEKVKRKAREINVMPVSVGERAGEAAGNRTLRWMLACGRAYGKANVALLIGNDSVIEAFDGASVSTDAESGKILSGAQPTSSYARGGEAKAGVAVAEETADKCVTKTTRVVDEDISYFMEHCATRETQQRWQAYDKECQAYLTSLGLSWEPFGLGAPVMLETNTIGFEILTEGPDGERFGQVLAKCNEMGVDPLDMQLVILLNTLQEVPRVRRRLRMKLGLRADTLLMSINIDDCLVRSRDFVEVVSRHNLQEMTLFEVNEDLEEDTLATLRQVADTYRLRLALDDSNNMKPEVREALLDRVDLVKVDFKFTRSQLSGIGVNDPATIMNELVRLRQSDLPLVVEGIETEQDMVFIQNHWRKEHGPIYFQGWIVQVSGKLDGFFSPANTPELPKGYRIAE